MPAPAVVVAPSHGNLAKLGLDVLLYITLIIEGFGAAFVVASDALAQVASLLAQ